MALKARLLAYYAGSPPSCSSPSRQDFVLELYLAAAPAVALAWLIGRQTSSRKAIWQTGVAGIAVPLALSAIGSGIAQTAGRNLCPWPKVPGG
ncbi:MAG: hypothetical protein INH40_14530, partial [Acidobacteriaceae bacterium]|nr:hypothetical protein [Acidobacteriaceae bacterium]